MDERFNGAVRAVPATSWSSHRHRLQDSNHHHRESLEGHTTRPELHGTAPLSFRAAAEFRRWLPVSTTHEY
jgi:hypothetical protein